MGAVVELQRRIAGYDGQRQHWRSGQLEKVAANIARRYGMSVASLMASVSALPEPAISRRQAVSMIARDAAPDGRTFHFVASDGSLDRMGDIIDPSGWHEQKLHSRSIPCLSRSSDRRNCPWSVSPTCLTPVSHADMSLQRRSSACH
jgi:hypothetical protein